MARVRKTEQSLSPKLRAALELFLTTAAQEGINPEAIIQQIKTTTHSPESRAEKDELRLPLTVFSDARVGALEAIAFYLKEHCKLDFNRISELLNRPHTTLRHSHAFARKKLDGILAVGPSEYSIPLSLFADRSTSVQRQLVRYCHDELKLSFSAIAKLIARDPRTVWTAYHAKRKGAP